MYTEAHEGNSFQLFLWLYAMKITNHAQEYHYVDASVVYANDVRVRIHAYIKFLSVLISPHFALNSEKYWYCF